MSLTPDEVATLRDLLSKLGTQDAAAQPRGLEPTVRRETRRDILGALYRAENIATDGANHKAGSAYPNVGFDYNRYREAPDGRAANLQLWRVQLCRERAQSQMKRMKAAGLLLDLGTVLETGSDNGISKQFPTEDEAGQAALIIVTALAGLDAGTRWVLEAQRTAKRYRRLWPDAP